MLLKANQVELSPTIADDVQNFAEKPLVVRGHLSFEHFDVIYSYEQRFQKPPGITACRQYRRFMIETKWQTVT